MCSVHVAYHTTIDIAGSKSLCIEERKLLDVGYIGITLTIGESKYSRGNSHFKYINFDRFDVGVRRNRLLEFSEVRDLR